MPKYKIDYSDNLKILTYNIYYKSMLGIDNNYLPQKEAQENVKKVIENDYDIICLQETECLEKIFTIKNYHIINGKSGPETLTTLIKDKYHIIKTETTEFSSGRGIQLTIINKILLVNIHAPHNYNDFGNYNGSKNNNQNNYNNEFIRILEEKINNFIKSIDFDRIIVMGDFNEAFNHTNIFSLLINNKEYTMKTQSIKPLTCCNYNFIKQNDLIYDSLIETKLKIPEVKEPASDHLPVETVIEL